LLGPLLCLNPDFWGLRFQAPGGLAFHSMALQDPRPAHRDPAGEEEVRDTTLAERARAGDADAFATLFRRYQGDVSRVCRRLLGVGAASEDAVSEAFLRARRALDGFAPDRPFRTWLLSIASHHCIDQLRRRTREQKIFDPREAAADALVDPGPSPLRRLVGREERDRLLTAIEELPEKYRLPLVLRYFSEMDYAAIAEVLGVERVQVGTLLLRGRRKLRELLGAGWETP